MSRAHLLAAVLGPIDTRRALFNAACDQVIARFPKTIEHAGRAWWVNVHPGGPGGLATVMLFDSPETANPVHVFAVQLGKEFGHVPPLGAAA
jgi:CYTH domain-containing protein